MNHFRKLLSAILLLVLFLNIVPPAQAQENQGRLTMTVSEEALFHGDLVTVTIGTSTAFTTRGAGLTISYDPAFLEPVAEKSQSSLFSLSKPMTVNGETVIRISSFPGEEGHTVNEEEPLAVLAFRTIKPGEDINVEMTAAYLYDSDLNPIDLKPAEPVRLSVQPVPVKGIILEYETLNLEAGETRTLKATILPENASDKNITWTSSDETKVTVADGVLTGIAITEEPVTITASANGVSAQCSVNVAIAPDAGYTVTMPMDCTAFVGETITVSPVIENKTEGIYNAYDMTFVYNPDILEFEDCTDGPTVTVTDGKITVLHYGEDQQVGTSPFTLSFKVKTAGKATVTLENPRIDHSQNAVIQNAAKADCAYPTMTVTVQGYFVTLPEGFLGDPNAVPGEDYTFKAADKFCDYIFTGSTMGGEPVEIQDNGDGTYTVKIVSGTLTISVPENGETGKIFAVSLGEEMEGETYAQYKTDYIATLKEDDQYNYTVRVKIGDNNNYNGYYKSGDKYIIPGEDITGDITFTVTKSHAPVSPVSRKVTFQGSGADAASGNATKVAKGETYSFILNQEEGYQYSVTYQMGNDDPVPIWPGADGKYAIVNVTQNLVITVEKEEKKIQNWLEVFEYTTMKNGKTMYLVLVHEPVEEDQVYTYQEKPMYYSWVYNAWCILTPEEEVLTVDIVQTKLSTQPGEVIKLGSVACDINMSGSVNINDAQLAYNLYSGQYEKIDAIRFLNADVNADRRINVLDAYAVVIAIQ